MQPLFQHSSAQNSRPAPFLPMSRAEMDALGWDCCDVILVTGDAYIDHPSFGMALIGRLIFLAESIYFSRISLSKFTFELFSK